MLQILLLGVQVLTIMMLKCALSKAEMMDSLQVVLARGTSS